MRKPNKAREILRGRESAQNEQESARKRKRARERARERARKREQESIGECKRAREREKKMEDWQLALWWVRTPTLERKKGWDKRVRITTKIKKRSSGRERESPHPDW